MSEQLGMVFKKLSCTPKGATTNDSENLNITTTTWSESGGSITLIDLIGQIPCDESIASVSTYGAYDIKRWRLCENPLPA